jgi:hypothetical protein
VMYYFTIITLVMMPRGDPDETNRSYLRPGHHNWYQSITGVIRQVRPYFQKHTMRKHVDAHIRAIVVLTSGEPTGIYFLPLLLAIYFSVMTHRRKGKKLSFLPSGDVNPGSIPSRQDVLEDSPYHVVGAACPSCD